VKILIGFWYKRNSNQSTFDNKRLYKLSNLKSTKGDLNFEFPYKDKRNHTILYIYIYMNPIIDTRLIAERNTSNLFSVFSFPICFLPHLLLNQQNVTISKRRKEKVISFSALTTVKVNLQQKLRRSNLPFSFPSYPSLTLPPQTHYFCFIRSCSHSTPLLCST
jgi:hypothetical protein